LDSQRTGNGYGPNALGFSAIKDWAELRRINLLQWQIDVILELDVKRRELHARKSEEEAGGDVVIEDQPMTKDLFRSMFPRKNPQS
jgi:hypothetical protein